MMFAPEPDLKLIHRFIVISVEEESNPRRKRLILKSNDCSPFQHKCLLTGQWALSTNIFEGDIVNVYSQVWTPEDGFQVADHLGFIVTNPDNLISCTTVASSMYCSRKTWLNEKFKGWGVGNKVMTIGTLVHELLQVCTTEGIYNRTGIQSKAKEMLSNTTTLLDAYFNEMDEKELETAVFDYIPWILQFIVKYIVGGPCPLHEDTTKVKIAKVHDIEDNIWCHYHGVKGKVDFTVEVDKYDMNGHKTETSILPLELKTGKASFSNEHFAQATLYTLMMNERQYGSCHSALLLYLKDGAKLKEIKFPDAVKNSLIQRRNEYEYYLRKSWSEGPGFKDNLRTCSNCDHLLDCALMGTSFEEDKLFETVVMSDLFESALSHLNASEKEFFGYWMTVLNKKLESDRSQSSSQTQFFWNQSSQSREESGQGLSGMIIIRKKKFSYTFERLGSISQTVKPSSQSKDLSDSVSNWNLRDRVAVSLDKDYQDFEGSQMMFDESSQQNTNQSTQTSTQSNRDMVAIVTGFVESLEKSQITLSFDKSIHQDLERKVFRIDLLAKSSYVFHMNFNHLLRLMSPQDTLCEQLRKSVIMKFPVKHDVKMSATIAKEAKQLMKGSSSLIKAAMARTLTTSHYTLIQDESGQMNSFLTSLFKIFMVTDKKVILTSNNSALLQDLLLHLLNEGISFMKIGGTSRVNPLLHGVCEDTLLEDISTVSGIKKLYRKQLVVTGSIYQVVNHPYFELNPDPFDFCVLLETKGNLLTTSLGPLFRCKRFLLVRDKIATANNESTSDTCKPNGDTSLDGREEDQSLFNRLIFAGNVLTI